MSTRGHVVAVTCLALEARIALGPGVSVICNHASRLVAAPETGGRQSPPGNTPFRISGGSGVISFGIAGGLASELVAGSWVVAAGVQTNQRRFPTDPAWTQRLVEA